MAASASITLPGPIYDSIVDHARECAPKEVCGILSGRNGVATELVRGRNEAANPVTDYWIDGLTLLKQFDFEDRGEEMIAIYHSHPVDEPYPSATDARNAFYPDAAYLICSLLDPVRPQLKAYRLLREDLPQRPSYPLAVRGDTRFLAQHLPGGRAGHYDLVFIEDDGSERWERVRIVELEVVITD